MPIKQVIVPQAQQTNSSITEVIQQYEVHQHNSETCYSGPKGVQSRLASLWLFFFFLLPINSSPHKGARLGIHSNLVIYITIKRLLAPKSCFCTFVYTVVSYCNEQIRSVLNFIEQCSTTGGPACSVSYTGARDGLNASDTEDKRST